MCYRNSSRVEQELLKQTSLNKATSQKLVSPIGFSLKENGDFNKINEKRKVSEDKETTVLLHTCSKLH